MKKIIVPTDFSPTALNAAHYAAEMALSVKAQIILLHVYQFPGISPETMLITDLDSLQQIMEKDLNQIKTELAMRYGNELEVQTEFRMGPFHTELKLFCEEIDPYAVIMGSQGTTATERLFFGNHAIHTMQQLSWPVITVPGMAKFSGIRKIGLACDFRNIKNAIPIEAIKSLVTMFDAQLYILYTGHEDAVEPDLRFKSMILTEKLGHVKQDFHFLPDTGVDEAIIEFTDRNELDLLVILPHRRSFFDLLFHKSHTKKFVLMSHVPVMALHTKLKDKE